jgi:predicted Rossmann fold nucleotide-binding protein DprA/Smf involved in DNA uptake
LERWERAGLWVLTRADSEYPSRLKQRLKTASPPLLFGCGNRRLLQQGGVAVVGSRAASEADLAFARELATTVALQEQSIVSGGARGVDEAAMLAALAREGTAVGVLADRLLVATTSSKYRPHLMSSSLVLVSPFYPEAGFDVGNAMARNKYVYCLSDAAVVVVSSRGEGGTWNGAVENLKQGWVPLWVKPQPRPGAGNTELVRLGARELPMGEFDVALLTREATTMSTPVTTMAAEDSPSGSTPDAAVPSVETPALPQPVDSTGQGKSSLVPTTFYAYFLIRLQDATRSRAMSLQELAAEFDVVKTQLTAWLKQAESEGVVEKFKKPVRYRWRMPTAGQESLFGGQDAGLEPES